MSLLHFVTAQPLLQFLIVPSYVVFLLVTLTFLKSIFKLLLGQ